MKIALYSGSFDPFTNGHLDILSQASNVFDKVIVATAHNIEKRGFIPFDDRVYLIKQVIKNYNNIEADTYNGLTADYAKQRGINFLIRGLRSSADFDYEQQVSLVNKTLNPELETVFFISNHENAFISSSVVRELLKHNADISKFVPQPVFEYFRNKK